MANAHLLHATLRRIQVCPERWNQMTYRRRDQGCFAYHAALLAGAQLARPNPVIAGTDGSVIGSNHSTELVFNEAARALGFAEGDTISIPAFARKALRLRVQEAAELFDALNTLADLERFVRRYARTDECA
ncbi:hypothetical protein [Streptomyces millisiae]|uniref:Uncharacterized protein n=1 Tax=Streptomyces millisiae TaxID=3075542 RepID=A0ABU2LLS3_9ACTN|nr:hypothetical protein [Streptomyces sp. DSM 44918]MDT0318531.1 hypothetical protein [Streptomyces sp. DSM 44918]